MNLCQVNLFYGEQADLWASLASDSTLVDSKRPIKWAWSSLQANKNITVPKINSSRITVTAGSGTCNVQIEAKANMGSRSERGIVPATVIKKVDPFPLAIKGLPTAYYNPGGEYRPVNFVKSPLTIPLASWQS